MIIGGNYCMIKLKTPFQIIFLASHVYAFKTLDFVNLKYSYFSEYFDKNLRRSMITKMAPRMIRYTKVEPKFLINTLEVNPFSSK